MKCLQQQLHSPQLLLFRHVAPTSRGHSKRSRTDCLLLAGFQKWIFLHSSYQHSHRGSLLGQVKQNRETAYHAQWQRRAIPLLLLSYLSLKCNHHWMSILLFPTLTADEATISSSSFKLKNFLAGLDNDDDGRPAGEFLRFILTVMSNLYSRGSGFLFLTLFFFFNITSSIINFVPLVACCFFTWQQFFSSSSAILSWDGEPRVIVPRE